MTGDLLRIAHFYADFCNTNYVQHVKSGSRLDKQTFGFVIRQSTSVLDLMIYVVDDPATCVKF